MRRAAITTLIVAGAFCCASAIPQKTCSVSLRLIDMATGRDLPGLVRITDAGHHTIRPPELLSRGAGLDSGADESSPIHDWSVVNASKSIRLVPGHYTIEAIAGLETEMARQSLDLTDGPETRCVIRLKRFSDTTGRGWRAGNTHLHLARMSRAAADAYLEQIPRADGLDLVFVSYLERAGSDQTYISNTYRQKELTGIGRRAGVRLGNGEEHRHNFGSGGEGYGHVMFLNIKDLIQPVSIGPGITKDGTDGLPLQRGIDIARKQPACVVWCHNDWGRERIPSVVTSRLDAQNIFDGSIHKGYRESFYRDLNAGFVVPFSTGTDWFLYDFSRVYVLVRGELTIENWLRSLAEGRTFISNGPLLELTVAGHTVGEIVRLARSKTIRVEARAAGRTDFGTLELVRNGEVIVPTASRRVGGHYEAGISRELMVESPCWLALRTPPPTDDDLHLPSASHQNEFGRKLFAHTSAIHVELGGRRYFDDRAARAMLSDMQTSRDVIASSGRFADNQERARVLDVFADAIDALKMHIAKRKR